MFVIGDAKHRILTTRRSDTLTKMAKEIVEEAKRLGVMDEDLIELIKHIQKEGWVNDCSMELLNSSEYESYNNPLNELIGKRILHLNVPKQFNIIDKDGWY